MAVTGVSSATTSTGTTSSAAGKNMDDMTSSDFLNLLITEMTNQDPLQPMSNQDLMNEIGSIRTLQMNTDLDQTLQSLALQSSLGSASGMIGKLVGGTDANANPVAGVVTGVTVSNGDVQLQLDNGASIGIGNVMEVTSATAGTSQTGQQGG